MVDPTAAVDESAVLGEGTCVWGSAFVGAGVHTGAHCSIGRGAEIGRGTHMGDSVRISYGVFLPGRSQIGDRVFIGPNATFTDDKHPIVNNPRYKVEPPIVESDVSVGANATILPGVRLGQGCCVGAGAVVTKDVSPWTTVVGCPATALAK